MSRDVETLPGEPRSCRQAEMPTGPTGVGRGPGGARPSL